MPTSSAALPPTLIETELFGLEKGGFTGATVAKAGRFELADGGTLFLDEIGELTSWRKASFALALGLVLVAPAWAEEPARDDQPWLRRWSPALRQEMEELPPFFRDTHLNLHLRTAYLNRTNTNGTAAEALTTGGWIDYKSGWLLDTFAVGAVGYLSEPLYAPRDRDGTSLLEPGQQGYVNRHDSRMTPTTFEGVTLSGRVGPVEYYGGYLARMKPRDEDEFSWMTQQAGIARHKNGLGIASVRGTLWEDLSVYAAEYHLPNGYNTAFGRVSCSKELGEDLDLSLGFQYTDQRSVGAQFLGDFVT